ncbi:cordon-bleu protein-like 1 isoform X2 [Hippocampus zosterae]|uniref:cordon-bleu protein-like 1 isoform X2 n=1 Tax=Hippocampus zosterae TaxID=109293 RepID=UPI00223D0B3E|nr:cordon-bleu protein-like 1 isoform X2 [Hippocampus zosterae]
MENQIKRPYVPEATVRLLINYNKNQKTVLRVNPQLPLETLLPLVCDKCDLRLETTVLLRDRQSKESLDIAKTLNEYGLREVFARDTADKNPLPNHYQACTYEGVTRGAVHHMDLSAEKRNQKENRVFLSLCRRLKKKAEIKEMMKVNSSSGVSKQKSADVKQQDISYSNTLAGLPRQKRRAPLPPMGVSRSVPNNLSNFSGSQVCEINCIGRKEGQKEGSASSLWQQAAGSAIRHCR